MKLLRNNFYAKRSILLLALLLFLTVVAALRPVDAQTLSFQRDRSREMLASIKRDLQKNYYDPTFRGVDVESVFKEADELLKKAESHGQMYGIIARALLQLNDSHTFFVAPSRVARLDHGWTMQAWGDKCYIALVQPGSDAERKGLKAGDLVLSIDQMNPERANLWIIKYLSSLRPQSTTDFVVQSPNEQPRELTVQARIKQGKKNIDLTDPNEFMKLEDDEERDSRLRRHRYIETENVMIWKMPAFDLQPLKVDEIMDKARKQHTLILDLRGNGGGLEETLLRLIGNLFDRDIKVGDLSRRKEKKPLIAKTRGNDIFKGKVVVLIDSESGSSSELLARVVQLEKRGTVIGDRSAGAVMRSRYYSKTIGVDTVIFYGVSITDADLIMMDGKSLEQVGVVPDELLLPSQTDLQLKLDPVLARASELAGSKLDARKAGTLFPVEWRKY